jgi:hypothetical protein
MVSRPERAVFVAEGRKFDLLPHEVQASLSPLAASFIKTITERSMFRSVFFFVAIVRPSFRFASQEDDEYS